jgi:hypothetical protein
MDNQADRMLAGAAGPFDGVKRASAAVQALRALLACCRLGGPNNRWNNGCGCCATETLVEMPEYLAAVAALAAIDGGYGPDAAAAAGVCNCSLRVRLVGDGCRVCSPDYAAGLDGAENG